MMDISKAIEIVDVELPQHRSMALTRAWQTLKAAVSVQTANNKPNTPCPHKETSVFEAEVCNSCGALVDKWK